MEIEDNDFENLERLLKRSLVFKSNLKPSELYESKMISPPDSPYAGKPISYDDTPYWREPVDCQHPDHPARDISIMGPGQGGKTTMVILPTIIYTIDQDPCNIIYLTGHSELSDQAMAKIDFAIRACGLEGLIGVSDLKAKGNRTGDTLKKKDFKGCDLKMGSMTNHNLMRQETARRTIGDDISAARLAKVQTGDTISKFKTRTKSHEDTCKRLWISTPERKGSCMIEKQLLKSDYRLWMVECPKCGNSERRIDLRMPFEVNDARDMAGLTWKIDNGGNVIQKSVGYVCQKCAAFFTDQNKFDLLLSGIWIPTQEAIEPYHYGYKINGLYMPRGMTSWYTLACKWVECNPPSAPRKERDWQTFLNDDVGDVYEEIAEAPKATELLKRTRDYPIGIIPEGVSIADGNGDIILLYLAADCNGKLNDARIDWQVKARSRGGPTYSVAAGSCGTFISNQSADQKARSVRERWTYEMNMENSVWKLFDEILGKVWETDTGRKMKIFISGIDCGYLTDNIFNYIDRSKFSIVGLMGDKEGKFVPRTENIPDVTRSKSRHNLYMVNVNMIKDDIAGRMRLNWDRHNDKSQPHLYMNFPKYNYDSFFSHYESEHKKENDKGYFAWMKKSPTAQNHHFDCFDEKTEVLTINGWKPFNALSYEDRLATVNLPSNTLEYQKPTAIIKKQYSGKMVEIKSNQLNVLVTETHRMVVYRKKWNTKSGSGRMMDAPQIIQAKDLRATDTIKVGFEWADSGDDYVTLPELRDVKGKLVATEKRIKSELWASFLGLYVSEGGKFKTSIGKSVRHVVKLYQNEGEKLDKIIAIIDALPFKYFIFKRPNSNGKIITFCQKQLYLAISDLGKNYYSKTSGDWIKKQSKKTIQLFIDYAMLGDGHTQKAAGNHRTYYTTSQQLSADMQELILKAGNHAIVRLVYPPPCRIRGAQCKPSHVQYHISENRRQKVSIRRSDNTPLFKKVDFTGNVFCATVPNGTLVCRRVGKSFVAGNCEIYSDAVMQVYLLLVLKESMKKTSWTWADYANEVPELKPVKAKKEDDAGKG